MFENMYEEVQRRKRCMVYVKESGRKAMDKDGDCIDEKICVLESDFGFFVIHFAEQNEVILYTHSKAEAVERGVDYAREKFKDKQ